MEKTIKSLVETEHREHLVQPMEGYINGCRLRFHSYLSTTNKVTFEEHLPN